MAKQKKQIQRQKSAKKRTHFLPFDNTNYRLFGIGLAVIIVGYIFMNIGPVDSFWSLTLAPVVLVIGYLVIIPMAILYNNKKKPQTEQSAPGETQEQPEQ
ncbi:MAG: DUF3098 domain-containing protein [bacterium]|nr:DUF3098 domain-containing protein [bacterium]